MRGAARRRASGPHLPPVEEIELSSAHKGPRIAAAILLLVIGAGALVFAFMQLLAAQSGWQEIGASSGSVSCADEFTLLYDLGAGGESASAEKRALNALWSQATTTGYQLFTNDSLFADMHNMRYINDHPNETIEVDPALYRAFSQVAASGDRHIYLGPVTDYYQNLFFCQSDSETAGYDPAQDESLRQWYTRCAAYASAPQAVELELMDENKVCLHVSEDYLAFARQEEITDFIEFGWMKNAFLADYLADQLLEKGFTNCAISSYDGFVRNLDERETVMGINVFDRPEGQPVAAAVLQYTGPHSFISLRNYPAVELDERRFYTMEDGRVLAAYLDTADGLQRTAADGLIVYSETVSCGEMALELAPIYVADSLDADALAALAGEGVYTLRCEDGQVLYTDPDARLSDFYETESFTYTGKFAG